MKNIASLTPANMKRVIVLPVLFALLYTLPFFLLSWKNIDSDTKTPQVSSPNVILILMDDMGYGDLECYGGGPYKMPNITRLAAEGMRFTNYYVAQAVCTASRASLLTGCYPNRIGVNGAFSPSSPIALNPEEETIASILKNKGYRTAMYGKWHLGQKAPFLPTSYGFDEFTGLPYSHDYWPVNYDGKPLDTTTQRGRWPVLRLIEGNTPGKAITNLDEAGQLTGLYTTKAVEFIKRNKKNPFFLYLAHPMPHVPLAVAPGFKGRSHTGLYGDVMTEIDWSVGEIMKALEATGLTKNTIIIFTSDNGPWLTYGNHGGNTGGLREGKGTAWDGGVKVPMLMKWPGHIQPGTVCNNLAASMDILPTLASICKAKQPVKKIDGVEITSLLQNKPGANPRDEFVYYYDRCSLKGIRKGYWKLVFPNNSQTYKKITAVNNDGWPGTYASTQVQLALYDLRSDPGETLDLKERYPEVVAQLTTIADKYRKEIGDDLTKEPGSEIRPAAKVNLR
ncbi:MAG: sulfatase [Bacteroidota bacterium]